jgi:hypothetical protein
VANQLGAERLERLINQCREKCETLGPDELNKLDQAMAVEFDEHFKFQQTQAEAHVMELLSSDAANIVYQALGEVGSSSNGGWAKNTDTATKVIVTQLMAELLKMKLKSRGVAV